MDPITHGLLGATLAKTTMWRRIPRGVGMIGAIGAMAPDLDIFIWSTSDPTVGWVYHRHFTHSLLFIPLGGLLAALPFLWLKQFRGYRLAVIVTAILGYATHTLLDSLTTYGTQQLWPFADTRVTWDAMPIVDPVYTLILLSGLLFTALTKKINRLRLTLALALLYLGFGFWQHWRGVEAQKQLLTARRHRVTRARVLPAPGWLMLWRSVYVADGRLYADGLRLPWFDAARVLPGGSALTVTQADLPAQVQANAEAQRRFKIFEWFADGYLTRLAGNEYAIGDQRITAAPESLVPLWGLQFAADGTPQRWFPVVPAGRDYRGLVQTLLFGDERYQSMPGLSRP